MLIFVIVLILRRPLEKYTMSSSQHKSLQQLLSDLGPEIRQKLNGHEEVSELILASQMVWALIVKGAVNKEVCLWAGESHGSYVPVMSEGYKPLLEEVRRSKAEGQSVDVVAARIRENSAESWANFTEGLVQGIWKSL